MFLAFYLDRLNHHQAAVSDELYKLCGDKFCFIELNKPTPSGNKGCDTDYSKRPYLLQAWSSEANRQLADEIAISADVCVCSTSSAFLFQKARAERGLLTFELSERWLKKGFVNILSFSLQRYLWHYHFNKWRNKPIYKLCAGAFVAKDQNRLLTYKDKCYKWGYFTRIPDNSIRKADISIESQSTSIIWCGRFIQYKHPELAILMMKYLKQQGYNVHLDMFGSGRLEPKAKLLTDNLQLNQFITFHGAVSNEEIHSAMQVSDISVFTSDRREGWGVVVGESMIEGCAVVASDSVGSSSYLIAQSKNGLLFRSSKMMNSFSNPDHRALISLCEKVEWLLCNPEGRIRIQREACCTLSSVWSPENAAKSLLRLIEDIKQGIDSSILEGPCSKA